MANKKDKKKIAVEEIQLPEKVSASLQSDVLIIKGKKGEVKRDFKGKSIGIECGDKTIKLDSGKYNKMKKKIMNSYAAHIKNMIRGSEEGHTYTLKICSGHFPMNVSISNNQLIIKNFLGEKVPRTLKLKPGAEVKLDGDKIVVESTNKETAGQISADIEQLTRRAGFDTRIFQDGIYIIIKDGKDIS